MVNDESSLFHQNSRRPIRRQEGNELPEYVVQQLKDAVWAGLAHKNQEDLERECAQSGHKWIHGKGDRVFCKRCSIQKKKVE